MITMLRKCILPIIFLLTGQAPLSAGERLVITGISAGQSPFVGARVYIADESWNLYHPKLAEEFSITENTVSAPVVSLSCPEIQTSSPFSLLVLAEASAMSGAYAAASERLVSELLSSLPADGSQIAFSVFDERPFLLQDFTTTKTPLSSIYRNFRAVPASNGTAALLSRPAGAFHTLSHAAYKPVILLIYDSRQTFDADSIIRVANAIGATIYAISTTGEYGGVLTEITAKTGGVVLESAQSEVRAEEAAHELLWRIGGFFPCEITWRSLNPCGEGRGITIEHNRTGARGLVPAISAFAVLPTLDVTTTSLDFGCHTLPTRRFISLRARNGTVVVRKALSSNPDFSVVLPADTTIPDGEEVQIPVEYKPSDSLFTSTLITLISDVCPVYYTALAGCPGQRLRPRTVQVVSPNGSEVFVGGELVKLSWHGTPDGGTARVEFSSNGGETWNTVTEKEGENTHLWTVPAVSSQRCLLRVVYFRSLNQTTVLGVHGGRVNSARFSSDGESVITASDDKSIRIFTAKSGVATGVFPFPGANSGVRCADFRPNSSDIAAVAAENLTAMILDAATGAEKLRLEGHNAGIISCEFSADGKYLLTGSQDFTSRLWSIGDNIGIAAFAGHTGEVSGVRFTGIFPAIGSDTLRIMTNAIGDKQVMLYEALYPPGTFTQRPAVFPSAVTSVQYSQKAKAFAIGLANGVARVTPSPEQVGVEVAVGEGVTDIDLTNDGRLLAAGYAGGAVRIFGLPDGGEMRVLRGHTGAIASVRFSPDGTRIVTASADSTARIWDVNIGPLQADSSDSYWTIGTKRVSAKSLDFGAVAIGSTRDSTFSGAVCNGGTLVVAVDSIVVTQSSGLHFAAVGGLPRVLTPDSCGRIRLRFSPTDEKTYSATCAVYSGGRIEREFAVTGRGMRPLLFVVPLIDFGQAETGTYKDSSARIFVKNAHTAPLSINSVSLGVEMSDFRVLQSGSPVLAPGEIRTIEIRFYPRKSGRISDRIWLDYSEPGKASMPFGAPATIELFGEGICTTTTGFALISPEQPRIVTESGKRISVQYRVTPPPNFTLSTLPFRCSATASFNGTLLLPAADSLRGTMNGSRRTIKLVGERQPNQDVLFSLDCFTAFGDEDSTTIDFSDFTWAGCAPFALPRPVTVVFSDICRAGDKPRHFRNGSLRLYLSAAPNPMETNGNLEIAVGLRENGFTRLRLVDVAGRTIRVFTEGMYSAGEFRINPQLEVIPAGKYMIILETPTKIITEQITISR